MLPSVFSKSAFSHHVAWHREELFFRSPPLFFIRFRNSFAKISGRCARKCLKKSHFWHISGYLFMYSSTRESVSYALLLLLVLPLEEPMNTIFIGEMSIASKWHISQRVEQGGVCSFGKLIENISEFRRGCFAYVQTDVLPCFGVLVGCSQSVAEMSMAPLMSLA